MLLTLPPGIEPATTAEVLDTVLRHHTVLRARIDLAAGTFEIPQAGPAVAPVLDEGGPGRTANPEALVRRGRRTGRPARPVARCHGGRPQLPGGATGPGRLLLVIHHLAVDGVSWRILLDDLAQAWSDITRRRPPGLPPVATSFRAWAHALGRQTTARAAELPLWNEILAAPDRLPAPGVPEGETPVLGTVAEARHLVRTLVRRPHPRPAHGGRRTPRRTRPGPAARRTRPRRTRMERARPGGFGRPPRGARPGTADRGRRRPLPYRRLVHQPLPRTPHRERRRVARRHPRPHPRPPGTPSRQRHRLRPAAVRGPAGGTGCGERGPAGGTWRGRRGPAVRTRRGRRGPADGAGRGGRGRPRRSADRVQLPRAVLHRAHHRGSGLDPGPRGRCARRSHRRRARHGARGRGQRPHPGHPRGAPAGHSPHLVPGRPRRDGCARPGRLLAARADRPRGGRTATARTRPGGQDRREGRHTTATREAEPPGPGDRITGPITDATTDGPAHGLSPLSPEQTAMLEARWRNR